jgi:hypothetical protein
LVSADFSTEITSTVIWLNGTYNTDISCYRIVPYRLGAEILLDLQQIIPLPEAKDFQIQQRQKGAATAAVRSEQSGPRLHPLRPHYRGPVNRPGFDAASFLEEDADHAQQVPRRTAAARDPDGS